MSKSLEKDPSTAFSSLWKVPGALWFLTDASVESVRLNLSDK